MRALVRFSIIPRLVSAAAALWLGAGSAWAGGGGADAGTLQSFLNNTLCQFLGYTTSSAPCPQLFPNVTELVLETAGLENSPPEMVRAMNAITPTVAVNAGNPPAGQPSSLSPFPLSDLTPLAFKPGGRGTVSVTQLGDPSANSFFYAAMDGISPTLPPTMLYLVFDYPPLTNPTPANARGNDLADICLPLTVLNSSNTESPVPTLLRVLNTSSPPGNAVVVVGSCSGSGSGVPTVMATDLGLVVTVTFQSSPNSAAKHAVIEVQVPLLVTAATDPAYFSFSTPISAALLPIFTVDLPGFTPNVAALPKLPIGMSPVAAQFTASIANNSGANVPAVNAYAAIATDGEVLVSAPLP